MQTSALNQKQMVIALIEELEKLHASVENAVAKDIELAVEKGREEGKAIAEEEMKAKEKMYEEKKKDAVKKAVAKTKNEVRQSLKQDTRMAGEAAMKKSTEMLIELLYFSSMFDPFLPFQMEKASVMNCAAVAERPITAEALDVVGVLGKMMTTRPYGTVISHEEALQQCKDTAMRYVKNSGEAFNSVNVTAKQIRETLEHVKGLDLYYNAPVPAGVTNGVHPTAPLPPHVVGPSVTLPVDPMHAMVPEVEYYGHQGAALAASNDIHADHIIGQQQPQIAPVYTTPEAAAASGQNLVNQFFGHAAMAHGPVHAPAHGGMEYDASAHVETCKVGSRPESFKGDAGLGIQEMKSATEETEARPANTENIEKKNDVKSAFQKVDGKRSPTGPYRSKKDGNGGKRWRNGNTQQGDVLKSRNAHDTNTNKSRNNRRNFRKNESNASKKTVPSQQT